MARRITTVAELARTADLDVDELLIRLWDEGLERYRDPGHKIRRSDMAVALRVVNIPNKRQLTDPEYWMDRLDVDDNGLRALLEELGVPMQSRARTLPKGAVAKLGRAAHKTHPSPRELHPQGLPETEPAPPLEWRIVGHKRDIRFLSEDEVERIHWALVEDFRSESDPIDPPGVRNRALLGSAVFRQHTSFGDAMKYPTVEMAGAALFHALVHDHPFHNGNKRTALVSLLVLIDENGLMMKETCDEDELFELVLRLAQHKLVPLGSNLSDREALYIADWLRCHVRRVEHGDRAIQWRRLKQILVGHGCELAKPVGVGNRLNISRTVIERRRLGLGLKKRSLTSQVKHADDGRQATVDTVKKLRRDLWLDEEHGVDSQAFYNKSGVLPSMFISRYRKTLKRLAKL